MKKYYFYLGTFTFFLSGCPTCVDNVQTMQQPFFEESTTKPEQKDIEIQKENPS